MVAHSSSFSITVYMAPPIPVSAIEYSTPPWTTPCGFSSLGSTSRVHRLCPPSHFTNCSPMRSPNGLKPDMSAGISLPILLSVLQAGHGAYSQYVSAHDQLLHLRGAIGNGQCPGIPEVALHRVLIGEAHSAMDLYRLRGRPHGGLGGIGLSQR